MKSTTRPAYVEHAPPLPCHHCGRLTSISRVEPRENEEWIMKPLCAEHRAPEAEAAT